MSRCFFIAGTDTDVGKTLVSCGVLQGLNQRKLRTIGYKPVASGAFLSPLGPVNSDVLQLQANASVKLDAQAVNGYSLILPASPHIAAKKDGVVILPRHLSTQLTTLCAQADVVVVEGAGGWHTPLSDEYLLSTWVKVQQLPVILVVGMRLGCINHALLTADAIKAAGLPLLGWVANVIDENIAHYAQIRDLLTEHLGQAPMAEFPYFCPEQLTNAQQQEAWRYFNPAAFDVLLANADSAA